MLDGEDELLRGRALQEPTLTFTLPSIHDGITLDCRVYHPLSLSISPKAPPWRRHAAIVAHPYAPLGGCYDDPVVDVVASTLLRAGYLVCTFNFRGASGSAGRTSWTAKAERADYMSVTGFVAHYVHFLDPFRRAGPDQQDAENAENEQKPVLLLAGYSYGAMITTQLPSIDNILAVFKTPASGSPAAEIRLRAQHMADMENAALGSARAAALDRHQNRSPRKALAMRIGGDEQSRNSHDLPRRSFSLEAEEKLRDLVAKARKGHNAVSVSRVPKKPGTRPDSHEQPRKETEVSIQAVGSMTSFQPAYLLISPLQGLVVHLATMSLSNPFGRKTARPSKDKQTTTGRDGTPSAAETDTATLAPEAEQKLIGNPTLAIHGDQDVFVAAKRLREWARRLESAPMSQFRAYEVSTAGHFWTEEGVLYSMKDAARTFAEGLITPEPTLPERAVGEQQSLHQRGQS